jgi:plastocyanin
MRRIALLALLLACGGTSGSATGGGPSGSTPDGGTAVTINWTLAAETATVVTTVAAGTLVQWHNGDTTTHTVQPDTAPPPNAIASINPAATSAPQTITTPGTYHYHCAIHPTMHGTLIVQ